MMNRGLVFLLGVPYITAVLLFAVCLAPFLGMGFAFIGAFQKLILAFQNDLARVKYHPMQVAKRRFDDACYHAKAEGNVYAVKEKFQKDPLSFSSLRGHILATILIFITLLPFIVLYGAYKGPIESLRIGKRWWQVRMLKKPLAEVYKNWGKTYEDNVAV